MTPPPHLGPGFRKGDVGNLQPTPVTSQLLILMPFFVKEPLENMTYIYIHTLCAYINIYKLYILHILRNLMVSLDMLSLLSERTGVEPYMPSQEPLLKFMRI